ncbi:MAG: GNAT family N-acetyltransferase [bacterium]
MPNIELEKEQNENLEIVPVQPEDALEIQNLMNEASRSVYINGGKSPEDIEKKFKESTSEESIKKIENNIAALTENEKMLVVKVGDKIVGFCYVERGEDRNMLQASFVLPEFQSRGIATQMWQAAKGFLDFTKDTYLDVYCGNIPAINFYKKIGFVETGKKANTRVLEEMEMVLKGK